MPTVVFDNVSKKYRIGQYGYHSLREDIYNLAGSIFRLGKRDDKDTIWALKDVSFRVDSGEALGIIGPNGAGKTTTLRLIAGITGPTSGRIQVNGRLGVLIDLFAGFHPELTGRENIYLNGSLLGLTRKEVHRNFDAIVEFSELEDFIDTPMKRYSTGMMLRLAFSVTIYIEPEILIVDEILAVGDMNFQAKCWNRMNEIRRKGAPLIFVSHALAPVKDICTKAILLSAGSIAASGKPQDVISTYEEMMRRHSS